MFKKTPKNMTNKIYLLSAGCLTLGAVIFLLTTLKERILFIPNSVSQCISVIFLIISIYITIGYILKEYTFSLEISNDNSQTSPDFLIYEKKGAKSTVVCRIGLKEITYIGIVDHKNRQENKKERKSMRKYMYNSIFLQKKFTEIRFSDGDETISVLITYDDEIHNILKNGIEI